MNTLFILKTLFITQNMDDIQKKNKNLLNEYMKTNAVAARRYCKTEIIRFIILAFISFSSIFFLLIQNCKISHEEGGWIVLRVQYNIPQLSNFSITFVIFVCCGLVTEGTKKNYLRMYHH